MTYFRSNERAESLHYEREETEVLLSNIAGANHTLFKAGNKLQDANPVSHIGDRFWLPHGNYFLKVEQAGRSFFYPIPIVSYRGGPDKNGAVITKKPILPAGQENSRSDLPQSYCPHHTRLQLDGLKQLNTN